MEKPKPYFVAHEGIVPENMGVRTWTVHESKAAFEEHEKLPNIKAWYKVVYAGE